MRHKSAEEIRMEHQVQRLKDRITQKGRWHSKRRKSDTTRVWKKLFADLEILVNDEKHRFTNKIGLILVVYPNKNQYSLQVHRHNSILYHSVIAKRENDYNKIIAELNALLSHYDLVLSETPESLKGNRLHHINRCREYELKFAKTIE